MPNKKHTSSDSWRKIFFLPKKKKKKVRTTLLELWIVMKSVLAKFDYLIVKGNRFFLAWFDLKNELLTVLIETVYYFYDEYSLRERPQNEHSHEWIKSILLCEFQTNKWLYERDWLIGRHFTLRGKLNIESWTTVVNPITLCLLMWCFSSRNMAFYEVESI